MDIFPIEIIQQILQHLRPIIVPTPARIDDPGMVVRNNRNWWARQTTTDEQDSNEPLQHTPNLILIDRAPPDREDSREDGQWTRYLDILPLRL
jgi:hypothetical protein